MKGIVHLKDLENVPSSEYSSAVIVIAIQIRTFFETKRVGLTGQGLFWFL